MLRGSAGCQSSRDSSPSAVGDGRVLVGGTEYRVGIVRRAVAHPGGDISGCRGPAVG